MSILSLLAHFYFSIYISDLQNRAAAQFCAIRGIGKPPNKPENARLRILRKPGVFRM